MRIHHIARCAAFQAAARSFSRVGVWRPHMWFFGKIAYQSTPGPTMTTILVQSKEYLLVQQ